MDIEANRSARKWTKKELAGRVLWSLVSPLFKFSPRLLWGWRRFLLSLFGAKIGKQVQIHPSARIFIPWNLSIGDWSSIGFDALIYNLGPIQIGKNVTISQRVHLCAGTHDFRDEAMPLIKSSIVIDDNAWVCADSFIGPEVTLEKGAIAGARAVVIKSVTTNTIVAGNPAKPVSKR